MTATMDEAPKVEDEVDSLSTAVIPEPIDDGSEVPDTGVSALDDLETLRARVREAPVLDWGEVRRPWMRKFLNALAFRPVIAFACRSVRVSDESVRLWRHKEPTFDQAIERALKLGRDTVEEAALIRAVDGVPKAIFGKENQIIGVEMKYSDGLAEMLLKGYQPAKFREKQQVEVTHGLSAGMEEVLRSVRMRRQEANAGSNVRELPSGEVKTLEINGGAQDGESCEGQKPTQSSGR